jgi:hypothetical protein
MPMLSFMKTAVAGSTLVFGSLLIYEILVGNSSVIRSDDIGLLETTALITLGLIVVGLAFTFAGITHYLIRVSSRSSAGVTWSPLTHLSVILREKRSLRVLGVVALGYGFFFAVVSSTLVFQPGLSFSDTYGVGVPSMAPVICCGPVGQMPQIAVYITQQIALLLVPVNLILLFSVSWLVGLNAAIASYTFANRPRAAGNRWITGIGAFIGLFTVCPSCAGFFFFTTLGLGGAVGLALRISSLQTIFVAASIPVLLVTPILASMGRWSVQGCPLVSQGS